MRSNVSSVAQKTVSDTRFTSCSESAHVLCVRVVNARQLEHCFLQAIMMEIGDHIRESICVILTSSEDFIE